MMDTNTKKDAVYDALRADIVDGNFRPGERLVISDLSKRYSFSAMPVREALIRLQQDGFVEVEPHVGAYVANFDLAKFKEILLIRTELETLACRLAVPYVTEAVIKQLETLVREMDTCVQESDPRTFSKLNKKLHMTIYCASPYKLLQEMIYNLWERSEFMRNLYSISMKRISQSHLEHQAWIEAFRKKDEKRVMEILHEQKEKQFAEYIRVIEKG